jgi:tRNA1(Val) A37 N6-methylase TrmN6
MITVNDIVAASHLFVAQHLKTGHTAIDATAGNGNDALFLAGLVGESGTVYAFDIQQSALDKTKALLEQNNLAGRVHLHLCDHKHIPNVIPGPVQAIVFNLGYLPGGDKSLTTSAENSLVALIECLRLLDVGGVISIVTYSGHPGGAEEEELIANWCHSLNPKQFSATSLYLVNRPNNPPKLWLIKKYRNGR